MKTTHQITATVVMKSIFLLVCLLSFAIPASADTYTYKSVSYSHLLNVGTVSINNHNQGIHTADFTVELKSDDDLESVRAFCVDPSQPAAVGNNVNLPVDLVTPSAVNGGLQAAWLFDYASKDGGLYTNSSKVAALQLAIWEVIVEEEKNILNHVYNLDAGDFKVLTKTDAYNGAKTLLTQLGANFASADLAYLNTHYAVAKSPTNQDFILQGVNAAPTPEPSTALLVLIGAGLMGSGSLGRGIRRLWEKHQN